MLDHGIIVPTTHGPSADGAAIDGWAFPVLYVEKKYGTRRLCVQFQDLTAVTVKDSWPPLIQDPVESFRDAKVFWALDLLKAFKQIAVDEKSVHKLTMTTQWGCFSYKAMPFGIINGPSNFSRAIYLAMQRFVGYFVAIYIDDITAYSEDQEVHLNHLRQVFAHLMEVNMKLQNANSQRALWKFWVFEYLPMVLLSKRGFSKRFKSFRHPKQNRRKGMYQSCWFLQLIHPKFLWNCRSTLRLTRQNQEPSFGSNLINNLLTI